MQLIRHISQKIKQYYVDMVKWMKRSLSFAARVLYSVAVSRQENSFFLIFRMGQVTHSMDS